MNEPPNPAAFTLWYRRSRYFKWRIIASARTEAELIGHCQRSGEFVVLKQGEHPNDQRKGPKAA